MAITLPLELEDLNFLVGADFPEADEDALWRCAQAWADAASELKRLEPEAIALGRTVVEALGVEAQRVEAQRVEAQRVEAQRGDMGSAFADLWRSFAGGDQRGDFAGNPDGFISQLATACERLAESCDRTAQEVEYAKIQYISALIILGVTIAALLAMVWAGGISAGGIPVAIAAAHVTIRLVLVRLFTAIAFGAGLNVALDGLAQTVQLRNGRREEWDWAKTRRAAEDGAIFGAAGAGVFLAGGRLAPGLMSSPAGLLGATGATGAIGGAAAPLAHGEMPTGRDFLMAISSGLVGGLGPDLARGPAFGDRGVPTPDLTRLTILDPGRPDVGVAGSLMPLRSEPVNSPAGAPPPRRTAEDAGRSSAGWPSNAEWSATGAVGTAARPPVADAAPYPSGDAAARLDIAGAALPTADPAALASPRTDALIASAHSSDSAPAVSGVTVSGVTVSGVTVSGVTVSAVITPASPIQPGGSSLASAVTQTAYAATQATPQQLQPPAPAATSGTVMGSALVGQARPDTPAYSAHESAADASGVGEPDDAPPAGWELTEAQAVDLVRANVFATDAGLAFYPVGDEVRDFARAVNPAPGYVTLDLHGSPTGFLIDDYRISPEQFAAGLRTLRDSGQLNLPAGVGIKLLSCDTAVGGSNSPAAVLARELGVEILAPDQPVWTTMDGDEIVASPVLVDGNLMPADPPDGDWHMFTPAGEDVTVGAGQGTDGMSRSPDQTPDVSSRGGLDPGQLIGRDPNEIMAQIPSDWTRVPSRCGGGVVFRDPDCPGRQIRIMPGYPDGNRPDPVTHGPYATISQNGTTVKVPLLGNPTLDGSHG